MAAEERAPLIERAAAGEQVSARKSAVEAAKPDAKANAAALETTDVETRPTSASDELKALLKAWNAAGPQARGTFLLRINATIR